MMTTARELLEEPKSHDSDKKLQYILVELSDLEAEEIDISLEALNDKKNQGNLEKIYTLFSSRAIEFRPPFTSSEDFHEKSSDWSSRLHRNSLLIGILIDEKSFPGYRIQNGKGIDKKDIQSCEILFKKTQFLSFIVNEKDLEDLNKAIGYLMYGCTVPSRLPQAIAEAIIKLSCRDFPKETLQDSLKILEAAFLSIKTEGQKFLASTVVIEARKKLFIKFIQEIEKFEEAIQFRLNREKMTFQVPPFKVDQLEFKEQKSQSLPMPILKTKIPVNVEGQHFRCYIKQHVDLNHLPRSTGNLLTKEDNLILGDLHGNAIKLIFFLIRENIAKGIDEKDYAKLLLIYNKKTEDLTSSDLNEFNNIISKLEAVNPNNSPLVTLIGDVLADRGSNDFFTLQLLKQLKNKIPVSILLSNHDIEFIKKYEQGEINDEHEFIPWIQLGSEALGYQAISLKNLEILIQKKLVTAEAINDIIKEVYLPSLIAIDYRFYESLKEIVFMAHAPVPRSIIPKIANELGIEYDPSILEDPKKLTLLIEKINEKIHELIQEGQLYQYAKEGTALYSLIWERVGFQDERVIETAGPPFHETYLNGHDGNGSVPACNLTDKVIVNLDNRLGRSSEDMQGIYTAYYVGKNPNFRPAPDDINNNAKFYDWLSKYNIDIEKHPGSETIPAEHYRVKNYSKIEPILKKMEIPFEFMTKGGVSIMIIKRVNIDSLDPNKIDKLLREKLDMDIKTVPSQSSTGPETKDVSTSSGFSTSFVMFSNKKIISENNELYLIYQSQKTKITAEKKEILKEAIAVYQHEKKDDKDIIAKLECLRGLLEGVAEVKINNNIVKLDNSFIENFFETEEGKWRNMIWNNGGRMGQLINLVREYVADHLPENSTDLVKKQVEQFRAYASKLNGSP